MQRSALQASVGWVKLRCTHQKQACCYVNSGLHRIKPSFFVWIRICRIREFTEWFLNRSQNDLFINPFIPLIRCTRFFGYYVYNDARTEPENNGDSTYENMKNGWMILIVVMFSMDLAFCQESQTIVPEPSVPEASLNLSIAIVKTQGKIWMVWITWYGVVFNMAWTCDTILKNNDKDCL